MSVPSSVAPGSRGSALSLALVALSALALAGCATGEPRIHSGTQDAGSDSGQQLLDSSIPDSGMDAAIDAGPKVATCEACVLDQQCPQGENGTTPHICTDLNGTRLCLPRCSDTGAGCPIGFTCIAQVGTSSSYCIPQAAGCCLDQDNDKYGTGATCLGPDCNDNSANVNPGQAETCNNVDDNCNMSVDDNPVDCPTADCNPTGTGAFASTPTSMCVAGQCSATSAMACGQYSCDMGGSVGTMCATTCIHGTPGMEDDSYCAAYAHCTNTNTCEPDIANGGACVEDSDCQSNHCDNGFCCATGNCCAQGSDCPGFPGSGTVCDDSASCQGSQGTVSCSNFQCVTANGVANDMACDATTLANSCGLFKDVYCTGAANQTAPTCLTSCVSSTQCDTGAFCNPGGQCEVLRTDGAACTAAGQCASNYCANGHCCGSGTCCGQAADCPNSFHTNPTCDDAVGCQGSRSDATCVNSMCGTQTNVPDDSACTGSTVANTCGLYPSVYCNGGQTQTAPMCAASCSSDSDCDTNAHCDPAGPGVSVCVPDVGNGVACDEDSDCTANHCQNGYCCATGDCCSVAANCNAATYGIAPFCLNPTQCQGKRYDPVCTNNICQLGNTAVDDDSGCAGTTANTCGAYKDIVCTSAVTQPTPTCGTSCSMPGTTTAPECDATGTFCSAGSQCQSSGMQGAACNNTGECQSGLSCVDGRCCGSACNGACEACNVSGHEGTCWPIPANTDPSNECGGFSCTGYYAGWNGNNCQGRGAAADTSVACDGNRACQGPAAICPSQSAIAGSLTCNATCQTPVNGTCSGTLAGSCNNSNTSNQTCGSGICQVTVPTCANGAPLTCTPGSPGTETCNGYDDNCDGYVDNVADPDIYEPNSDPSVGQYTYLGTNGRSDTFIEVTGYVYGSGDKDYYYIDSTVGGCTGSTSYTGFIQVGLDAPAGSGTYQVCVDSDWSDNGATCTDVPAGNSVTVWGPDYKRDCGGCGGGGGAWTTRSYIRVNGKNGANSCYPYRLHVETWRCGSAWPACC
ncbi:MAG: putative metal-binding motif-containing protein [Polyangiales bacterium]